ncbi:DUF1428 domain-containing protein [Dehalogenimonas alkenigignens]|uniref:DUF1428 domain-containing protein n=1 Tax=Dehalogenimonas alkenigignens TaxID=1217799 RepID=A0A0W0GHJ7_9CHLR|nr:DUF1428 domain-containing protein [Dehalogenimonas alkenigignens]KTB48017.1 hypothetical protein DEALK_08620 [Dehalogenimonas alkenigignens]PVV84276.1 DUF1428 domain-containing protein [Dehalogenimonas alkenigignens]
MKYVDGYVIALPEKNMAAYRQMAEMSARVWKKHGALEYFECVGEDLNPKPQPGVPPEMAGTTFPKALSIKPGETVVFSFVVFKSRAHRDEVNAMVMKDPEMNDPQYQDKPMPFDMKRMIYGGFKVIAEA